MTEQSAAAAKPGIWFWLIALVLLLWALGGASIYVAYFVESPTQFAQTAEDAEHREAYADYVEAIPLWAIAVGVIAAAARLLGALGLLMRRAWALPCYVVSALFFLVFSLGDAASAMSPPHIAVEAVFLALSLFAIWFAYANKRTGVLT
jgi:hypothetical protein